MLGHQISLYFSRFPALRRSRCRWHCVTQQRGKWTQHITTLLAWNGLSCLKLLLLKIASSPWLLWTVLASKNTDRSETNYYVAFAV